MTYLPENIQKTIEAFSKLPGIGEKSAQRLTFYLLRKHEQDVQNFGKAVHDLKSGINYCKVCCNLCTNELCGVCQNTNRNKNVVCVVEEMMDLIAVEKSGQYEGVYHVLHGVISPMEGVGPDELRIAELIERIKAGNVDEIILALNPSIEGEATAAYIVRGIQGTDVKITRLARGIPVGGDLEYADSQTLKQAMENRKEY